MLLDLIFDFLTEIVDRLERRHRRKTSKYLAKHNAH